MRRTAIHARLRLAALPFAGLLLVGMPAPARGDLPAGAAAPPAAADTLAPAEHPPPPSRLFLPRDHEGSWLRSDRALHFGVSLAMAASWRVEGRGRTAAFGLSAGAGLLKEAYDAAPRSRPPGERGASRRDLVADLLGAAAGVLLLEALDR